MRFNYTDLRNGSISDDRFKEVVREVVRKLDERFHNRQDIERIGSQLLSQFDAELFFKKDESGGVNFNFPDSFEFKEHVNKIVWRGKVERYNRKLMEFEAAVIHEMHEKLLKELDIKEALAKENASQSVSTTALESQMRAILLERLRVLMLEREQLLNELRELQREKLINLEAIKTYQKLIKVARKECIDEMTQNAKDVQVNGVYTFEGMSDEQISKFNQGFVTIEEVKRNDLAELEAKYVAQLKTVRKELKEAIERDPSNEIALRGAAKDKERRINQEWQEKVKEVNQKAEALHIQNGDITSCKHINSQNREEAKKHIQATKDKNEQNLSKFHKTTKNLNNGIKQTKQLMNSNDLNVQEKLKRLRKNEAGYSKILGEMSDKESLQYPKILEHTSSPSKNVTREAKETQLAFEDLTSAMKESEAIIQKLDIEIQKNQQLISTSEDLSEEITSSLLEDGMDLNDLDLDDLQIDLSDVDLSSLDMDSLDLGNVSLDDLAFDEEELHIKEKEEDRQVLSAKSSM